VSAGAEGLIMAGVDGSAPSAGGTLGGRRGAPAAPWARPALAYQIPIVGHPEYEYPPESADSIRAARRNTLEEVASDIIARYPDLDITN
jgi:hypothetical protein